MQTSQPISRKNNYWRRIDWIAYLYLLPGVLIITVFHIIPVGYALWISLQGGRISNFRFIGLDNYLNALQAPEFWNAMTNTVYYVIGTVPITIALSLGIAYLLFQKIRGRGIYRVIYFLPHIVSSVASSIVWAWVFNPTGGIANRLIGLLGIPPQKWLIESDGIFRLIGQSFNTTVPEWLNGPSLALVSVMIFAVWHALGFDVVIFLAGLTNINPELYEAARVDGANRWHLFLYITIPLLAPTIFFVLVISLIGSFQAFNQIYTMNRAASQPPGGPLGSTATVSIYMFNELYNKQRAGYATSVSVLLSMIIMFLTLIQFKYFNRREVQ